MRKTRTVEKTEEYNGCDFCDNPAQYRRCFICDSEMCEDHMKEFDIVDKILNCLTIDDDLRNHLKKAVMRCELK